MSAIFAIKTELEQYEAKRAEAQEAFDKADKKLKTTRREWDQAQGRVIGLSDRIEALRDALKRLERDQ